MCKLNTPFSVEVTNSSTPRLKKKINILKKNRTGKIRKTCEYEWIDVKRKTLHNLGKEYVSRNGIQRGIKMLKPSCGNNCRLKCSDKITEENRKTIFTSFWELGDHSQQWHFISKFTKRLNKQRITTDGNSKRNYTVKYFLPLSVTENPSNVTLTVCKEMFRNTLSISNQFIVTAIQKYYEGNVDDQRGRHRA